MTDGIQDQFGGTTNKGKKFTLKRILSSIEKMKNESISNKVSVISQNFEEWKEDNDQTDD
jgi:hypothetical protein